MSAPDPDRFAEIKRCLARADEAFARAGSCEDLHERLRLMDQAEDWLIRAERAFSRLTDRMTSHEPRRGPPREPRSFQDPAPPEAAVVWRAPDGTSES